MNLYKQLEQELNSNKFKNKYNNIKTLESPQGAYINISDNKYLNMCSNNYLGWSNDALNINSFKKSADLYGVGPGAVRSISGTFKVHREFEKIIAKFKGVEDIVVVQSGFQANTGLIPTITTQDDLIISDELNHASIIDGIRLSKASRAVYKHCDMNNLKEVLDNADVSGNIFIVTDGVFSMDGDIAPLDEINKLAKTYNAYTIVDDAHGEGVLGENGRGAVNHFNLEGEIDIEIGTLSKAFGIAGGFIGGKKILIDYLKQKARPFLFSTGLDMGMCYSGIQIIKEMENDDTRVKKLWENANYLQNKITKLGYSIGKTQTPITPFMVYDEALATKMTESLFEQGILVSPIIYPTVAKGKARLRLMVSSLHSKEELDYLVDKVDQTYRNLNEK